MTTINTTADITRLIGSLAENTAFVADKSGTQLGKAGIGHRLAKHFGMASALRENTRTLDAIKTVLRQDPAYSGIAEEDFNSCFSQFAGGHAVTGARLKTAIKSLAAFSADKAGADFETSARRKFQQVADHAATMTSLLLNDTSGKCKALQDRFDQLCEFAGMGSPKDSEHRQWLQAALTTVVKRNLQTQYLAAFKETPYAAPKAAKAQVVAQMIADEIRELLEDCEQGETPDEGWANLKEAFEQKELFADNFEELEKSIDDAIGQQATAVRNQRMAEVQTPQ